MHKIVSVPVKIQNVGVGAKNTFPNTQLLNGKTVCGIGIRSNPSADAKDSDGNNLITDAQARAGFVTFRRDSDSVAMSLPLTYLHPTDCVRIWDYELENFNPQESEVVFSIGTVTVNTVVEFIIRYKD